LIAIIIHCNNKTIHFFVKIRSFKANDIARKVNLNRIVKRIRGQAMMLSKKYEKEGGIYSWSDLNFLNSDLDSIY